MVLSEKDNNKSWNFGHVQRGYHFFNRTGALSGDLLRSIRHSQGQNFESALSVDGEHPGVLFKYLGRLPDRYSKKEVGVM